MASLPSICQSYSPPGTQASLPNLSHSVAGTQVWYSDVETATYLADNGWAMCGQPLSAADFILYAYHFNDQSFNINYTLAIQNPSTTNTVTVTISNMGTFNGQGQSVGWSNFYAGGATTLTLNPGQIKTLVQLLNIQGGSTFPGSVYGVVALGTANGPIFVYDYCWQNTVASTLSQTTAWSPGSAPIVIHGTGNFNLVYVYPFGTSGGSPGTVLVSELNQYYYILSFGWSGDSFGGADLLTITDQQNPSHSTQTNTEFCIRFLVEYQVSDDTGSGGNVTNTVTSMTSSSQPGVELGSQFLACVLPSVGSTMKGVYDSVAPNGTNTEAFQVVYCGGYNTPCSLTISK